ncbi:Transcriptional regulator, TrmB family [Halapricum desulfuricans]|uniref:Transcriptional regulator, TrmB family n=1 Tax=Halapricum desulfuricans TaxID=2841257 RepID=A0A897NE64_9EURY|nr:PaaX domain-containing protein [Halapricum desulfuricans]QSG10828.1 Transcriptional regulator, TrmB family [Halapricum desulfuricans]
MPIDLRRRDPDDPITIRPETAKAKVIKLLYSDTGLGFTPAEIRDELDLPRGTVSGTLSRLHDEGIVGKTSDGLYHGLDHRDDLRRFARSLVSLETMFSRHPEAGMDPDTVEQTGGGAKREIPPERLERRDTPNEEPEPDAWIAVENSDKNAERTD